MSEFSRSELLVRGAAVATGRPLIMGVLNATPDSFSDDADGTRLDRQLHRLDELIEGGCDIVDIGGQSAITGVEEISPAVEIERIAAIVGAAVGRGVTVSVDTYRAEVAAEALRLGAHIVNDISGLKDPAMPALVASTGAGYVLMHNPGRPKQRLTQTDLYVDVVEAVDAFVGEGIDRLVGAGVDRRQIVVDFGPDFAKTPRQTVECLRAIERFAAHGQPLLLALSRKDFIGAALGLAPRQRDDASLGAILWATGRVSNSIVRTHNVAGLRQALDVIDHLEGLRVLGEDDRLDTQLWRQRTESRATREPARTTPDTAPK